MNEIIALLKGIFLVIVVAELTALTILATGVWLFCADRARMIRTAVIPACAPVRYVTTGQQSPQDASPKGR